jgi:hypothetical protein
MLASTGLISATRRNPVVPDAAHATQGIFQAFILLTLIAPIGVTLF